MTGRVLRGVALLIAFLGQACFAQDGRNEEDAPRDQAQAERLRSILAAPPPQAASPEQLARQYLERIRAARLLDLAEREAEEIEWGIRGVGADKTAAYPLFQRLANYSADRGDLVASLRAREQALKLASSPGQELNELGWIASLTTALRDRARAEQSLARAQTTLQRLRPSGNWARFGDVWQANFSHASAKFQRTFGTLDEAETASRMCIASIRAHLGKEPDAADAAFALLVECTHELIAALARSGRIDDAAPIATEMRELARDYAAMQGRAAFAARMMPVLVRVAVERGRFAEARADIDFGIQRLRAARAGEGSTQIASLRYLRAAVEMLEGNWQAADEQFAARRSGLQANREQARMLGTTAPEWAYAQLRLGRKAEALEMLNGNVATRTERLGEDVLATWEARGFRAIALVANGRRDEALREFSAAVPRIIALANGERASSEAGLLRTARLNWIFSAYLSLLADVSAKGERTSVLDPVDESFRLADMIRGSTVQRALSLAASRAVVADRGLAELSRRYHDQQRDIGGLSDGLGNLLARGRVASMDDIVTRIRRDLETLRSEQARVQLEIERKFPAYANLIDPRPPGIADVQQLLRPGEVLVSLLVGAEQSHVWAVPATGAAGFATLPAGAAQLARLVDRLRSTLEPGAISDPAQIRAFDFETAHALYRQLLAPVEATLRDARSIVVVAHGDLGRLPFAVLTTAPFTPTTGFKDYPDAPWLIKRVAVSQLPSISALPALRRAAPNQRAERPFVGFGDPVFSKASRGTATQRTFAARSPPTRAATDAGDAGGPAAKLHLLEPLPETAAEVREIARLLGADERRDVFLGERASEKNVKSADLELYRTVMFATHSLLPGNLPGLSQPALALSHPSVAGEGEDGLLMLDEVLGLRLQADWVVLSACSTASPDVLSSEALSGLGRAFFFAGARALLVTAWAVETESAQVLTTAMFRALQKQAGRPAAQALQEASIEVMRQRARGPLEIDYAHPMFWAPFVLVGDGS